MNFFLFMLVTATLFIRPGEVIPTLRGSEIFFYLFVPCLLLSFQSVLGQLSQRSLKSQPITVCVLGLLPAVLVSNLAHLDIDAASNEGWVFLKNVMYYILLVSLVNTPTRLRQFLFWLWFFALVFIVLIFLQHYGYINLNMDESLSDTYYSETGELIEVTRLKGSGLFGDPNDLCVVIILGSILSLYWMGDRLFRLPRLLHLVSLLIFGYALMQTQSRGGFIAFMVACGVLALIRYGWKKGALLVTGGLPILLIVFKGRLTAVSTEQSSAHSRIGLWSDGLEFFKGAPIFGIGANKFRVLSSDGQVAHNSFLHAYSELGLFGGILFLGAFFLALRSLYLMGTFRTEIEEPNLQRAQPFMLALIAGIATLLLTLSQTYYMSTYMVLGLVTAYLRVSNAINILKSFRVGFPLVKGMLYVNIIFLVGMYIFVRLFK